MLEVGIGNVEDRQALYFSGLQANRTFFLKIFWISLVSYPERPSNFRAFYWRLCIGLRSFIPKGEVFWTLRKRRTLDLTRSYPGNPQLSPRPSVVPAKVLIWKKKEFSGWGTGSLYWYPCVDFGNQRLVKEFTESKSRRMQRFISMQRKLWVVSQRSIAPHYWFSYQHFKIITQLNKHVKYEFIDLMPKFQQRI